MREWLIIIAGGAGTYAIRASMLLLAHARPLPDSLREALRFIAPAIMAAFIAQLVLYVGDPRAFDASPGNERLLAAVAAAGIAWLTRSTWLTIAGGMCVLWLLQWAT